MRLSGTFEQLVDAVSALQPHRGREGLERGVRRNARVLPDGSWGWKWDPAFRPYREPDAGESMLRQSLRDLSAPVTIVAGTRPGSLSPDQIAGAVDLVAATARVVTIEGAGHNVHSDAPQAVARVVSESMAVPRR
jgi:pimeloyl-ACP methyl ester carboxylesterase